MKKETYYCDKCNKEIVNNVNYLKVPTEKCIDKDMNFVKYKRWETRELCDNCIKPVYEMFKI